MSNSLQVILAPEQLAELADLIAAKLGETRYSKNAPLSINDAAKRLNVSRETIRLRIQAGMIRTIDGLTPRRIAQEEIDRILTSHPTE